MTTGDQQVPAAAHLRAEALRAPVVRGDEELFTSSGDHFHYGPWMLQQAARRLRYDDALHRDRLVKNAVIESFAIHARVLTEFLFPEREKRKRDTDIVAQDYMLVRTRGSTHGGRCLRPSTLCSPARRRRSRT